MEADYIDAGVKAVKGLFNNATVVAITASQRSKDLRFNLYVIMRSAEPSLSKEVDTAAEGTHAEMGGGKDLAEDHNVVVIAGIGLVEVSGHSSSE